VRKVRLGKDGKAPVALRHGQVVQQRLIRLIKQLGLRRLLIVLLRRL
jgi:hypothetical protein